jgi:KUP system potassium uptake protein
VLDKVEAAGLKFDAEDITYFLGRETIMASRRPGGMPIWREKIFALISRNATSATAYFCLPPDRVVEMGSQVEI